MEKRLDGKRILVTQAADYMGPAIVELFREHGADLIADESVLRDSKIIDQLVRDAGEIDVLVANLASDANFGVAATDVSEGQWAEAFDVMVHPLYRLVKAVLPRMIERAAGKIVVIGSATGIKGMESVSAYSAARSAQVGYVRAVGLEAAHHNVQINLVAQNWVENPAYFPPAFTETPAFKALLEQQVPLGRLADSRESALLALFLASSESDFFVGQAIPFSGGWAQ